MKLLDVIKKIFRKINIDIGFYPSDPSLRKRLQLIKQYQVSTLIDVGANSGQFALEMRGFGFTGKILSFEPQKKVYSLLEQNAKKDLNWKTFNYALGDFDGTSKINIAQNSYSSSLLDMLPAHLSAAPQSKFISEETIVVKKLDTVLPDLINREEKVFLKIDTQGFEKNIINGARNVLNRVVGMHVEMSLVPLYRGDTSFEEMNAFLNTLGFYLCSIEMEFDDPKTKKLLQIDGIYFKMN
jgi:FkbM family methyltransferase